MWGADKHTLAVHDVVDIAYQVPQNQLLRTARRGKEGRREGGEGGKEGGEEGKEGGWGGREKV